MIGVGLGVNGYGQLSSGSIPPPAEMTNTVTSNLATWNGNPVATNVVTANLAEWN